MEEFWPWFLGLRRTLKSHLRSALLIISTLTQFIDGIISYILSIEISEDMFFLSLLFVPALAAYLLDRFDREQTDEELANEQKPAKIAFTSPTLKSEEIWEKYDQLQQSKVPFFFLNSRQ